MDEEDDTDQEPFAYLSLLCVARAGFKFRDPRIEPQMDQNLTQIKSPLV